MKIDPRRGRVLVLTEPMGIVRALGSLLLICSALALCRGLLMIHWQEQHEGISSPHFWSAISIVTFVLGVIFSSPPRWRWVFDEDFNNVRSFTLRFNVPERDRLTFDLNSFEKAEISRHDDGRYWVELIDDHEHRIKLDGISSRNAGWPKQAAFTLNAMLVNFNEHSRGSAPLNDPGVHLREAGIVVPSEPLLAGPALEEFFSTLPPEIVRLTSDIENVYRISLALSNLFSGRSSDLTQISELFELSSLQAVLFFDLCVPALKLMHQEQFLALSASINQADLRPVREAAFSYALSARFNRFVAKTFRASSVEPPIGVDLQSVLKESKMAIATIAALAHSHGRHLSPPKIYEGREVVYVDASTMDRPTTLSLKAYEAGIQELSPGMASDWVKPAETTLVLHEALSRVVSVAPVPMRSVLVRACARAATADILEPIVWLTLRAIADDLSVSVPTFVPEPIAEARVDFILPEHRLNSPEHGSSLPSLASSGENSYAEQI